jgi:hypothetical protein
MLTGPPELTRRATRHARSTNKHFAIAGDDVARFGQIIVADIDVGEQRRLKWRSRGFYLVVN